MSTQASKDIESKHKAVGGGETKSNTSWKPDEFHFPWLKNNEMLIYLIFVTEMNKKTSLISTSAVRKHQNLDLLRFFVVYQSSTNKSNR